MMKKSPPSPSDILRRVLRVARFDGLSVVIVAGIGTLLAAAMADWVGVAIGLAVASAGTVELQGAARLRRSDSQGMKWLVASQLILMGSILVYCAYQLTHPQLEALRKQLGPMLEDQLAAAGISMKEFLALVSRLLSLLYYTVACITVLYQGGMTLFYLRQREKVARALNSPPPIPTTGS